MDAPSPRKYFKFLNFTTINAYSISNMNLTTIAHLYETFHLAQKLGCKCYGVGGCNQKTSKNEPEIQVLG